MKRYMRMWQIWAVLLPALLIVKGEAVGGILRFLLILVCPLMMLFMHSGHKHK